MKSLSTPLLSVVIPTHKRPQFLSQAIESALQAAPDGEVEVIVVPNGADDSWKEVANNFKNDSRAHWHPISKPHANSARNKGLKAARGKYVRFLDDDDYLSKKSTQQLLSLDASGMDVSMGAIELIDENGNTFKKWLPVRDVDFTFCMLSKNRITHNCSLLFKKTSIENQQWDEYRNIGQDTAFALKISQDLDLEAHQYDEVTGFWRHHSGSRISAKGGPHIHSKTTVMILFEAVKALKKRGAFNNQRCNAAIDGIWSCIHNAFPLNPFFWHDIISEAELLFPNSRPEELTFKNKTLNSISPSILEWAMTPHRWVKIQLREQARRSGKLPPW